MNTDDDKLKQEMEALKQRVRILEEAVDELKQKNLTDQKKEIVSLHDKTRQALLKAAKIKRIKFLSNEIPGRLTKMIALIVEEIEVNPERLRTYFNISRQTLSRDIAILRKLEWLRFKGGTINGVYCLTEKGAAILNVLQQV